MSRTVRKSDKLIRMPCAIGFYPGDRGALLETINECYLSKHGPGSRPKVDKTGPRRILAGISPHAGYIYSGPVAASLYYQIASDGIPDTFVLVGPVHGFGAGVGIMKKGVWRMPMGDVRIDEKFCDVLLRHADIIADDPSVHEDEHSLEVQLPFLQALYGDQLQIVPIATSLGDLQTCREIGKAIVEAANEVKRSVVIIASTDMTHYGINYGFAPVGMSPIQKVLTWIRTTDGEAIKAIEALDAGRFLNIVKEKHMTICGYAPVAVAIVAAKESGVSKAELVKYATSYDTQSSTDAIVGYCSMLMKK